MFDLYKVNADSDITYDFFDNDDKHENFYFEKIIEAESLKFYICINPYKTINHSAFAPFVKKYFTPSQKIKSLTSFLIKKYNINTQKCIGLYYRGTDKITETQVPSFDSFYNMLMKIYNKDLQIIVQTDSKFFLEYMQKKCADKRIIVIKENLVSSRAVGIHFEESPAQNYKHIQFLFSTFLIISQCKYILCSSSNGSVWMIFFRGNADSVFCNINNEWTSENENILNQHTGSTLKWNIRAATIRTSTMLPFLGGAKS
jgi:hypothetical protein